MTLSSKTIDVDGVAVHVPVGRKENVKVKKIPQNFPN